MPWIRHDERILNMNTDIAIIVLALNKLDKTRECLESLRHCTGVTPRVFLWDNGSTDGTADIVRKEFPEVIVRRSPVNLGAAAGRNALSEFAIRNCAPDFLLFVDNDAIVHPGAISALACFFTDSGRPRLAQTTAKILFPGIPPVIYAAGGSIIRFWLGSTKPRGHSEPDLGQYGRPEPCIPGAGCTLVRRDVFEEIGGFDTGYDPYGYEDLDFTLRLIAAGYECFYVPDAIAYHERGQTFGSGRYTAAYASVKRRNWLLFLRRHAPLHQRLGFYLLGAPLRLAKTSFRELRCGNLQAIGALLRIGRGKGREQ